MLTWRQCCKTDLVSASCSWMQGQISTDVLHKISTLCVCSCAVKCGQVYLLWLYSTCCKKKIIGAKVLPWPLTSACLCHTHMLTFHLSLKLFLIIFPFLILLLQTLTDFSSGFLFYAKEKEKSAANISSKLNSNSSDWDKENRRSRMLKGENIW